MLGDVSGRCWGRVGGRASKTWKSVLDEDVREHLEVRCGCSGRVFETFGMFEKGVRDVREVFEIFAMFEKECSRCSRCSMVG